MSEQSADRSLTGGGRHVRDPSGYEVIDSWNARSAGLWPVRFVSR